MCSLTSAFFPSPLQASSNFQLLACGPETGSTDGSNEQLAGRPATASQGCLGVVYEWRVKANQRGSRSRYNSNGSSLTICAFICRLFLHLF